MSLRFSKVESPQSLIVLRMGMRGAVVVGRHGVGRRLMVSVLLATNRVPGFFLSMRNTFIFLLESNLCFLCHFYRDRGLLVLGLREPTLSPKS